MESHEIFAARAEATRLERERCLADATWNPITGCSVVSAGCRHCYAMRLAGGRMRHHPSRAGLTRATSAGPVWTGEVRLNESWLDHPLRWREPRRICVCAHGDLFHESVPDEWIDRVFAVMALAPQHTFLVLTKRPKRMREYIDTLPIRAASTPARAKRGVPYMDGRICEYLRAARPGSPPIDRAWPLGNVWLGVSVEDQATADERIPLLLQTPAALRFVSAAPLLEPVHIEHWLDDFPRGSRRVDWVIVGGESGPRARLCDVDWIRSIVEQCRAAAGTACFVKQVGAAPIVYHREAARIEDAGGRVDWDDSGECVSARMILRSRTGSDPAEWPADLRVREFPA